MVSAVVYPSGRYRDIFIGNKPAGLGGAFIGLADDNNAVWYNPAGMAWIKGSCVGTSPSFEIHANGRTGSFLGEDEAEASILFVPTALSSVSDAGPGKLGLGVFMPVKSAFTQTTTAGPVTVGPDTWAGFLDRTENEEIFYLGGTYGYRINDQWSIGGGVYYVSSTYAHNLSRLIYDPTVGSPGTTDFVETNIKESEKLTGFTAMIGGMFKPVDNVKIGLTYWLDTRLSGDGLYKEFNTQVGVLGFVNPGNRTLIFNTDNDTRIIPGQIGLGVSWQINEKWMLAADVISSFGAEFDRYNSETIELKPVVNYSVGFEWRITENVPFRFGLFSNNSYYPEVDDKNEPQKPHVDVGGVVIGAGYEGEENKFYGGLKIGSGTGDEKIFDQVTGTYEAVDATSYTIGIVLGMNYSF
jgi:long-subunit fatty acid transport protein